MTMSLMVILLLVIGIIPNLRAMSSAEDDFVCNMSLEFSNKIELYNSLGGFVKSIPMNRISERFLSLNMEGFPGGVYLVRMQVDDSYIIKKLTIGK